MSTMRPAVPECELRIPAAEDHCTYSMGIAAHAAGIGIGIIGFCGRIKESNLEMNHLAGLNDNGLLGKDLTALCAEEFRHECFDMLQEVVMGLSEKFDLEALLKRNDGHRIWVHLTGNVIPGTSNIVITMHDTSDYIALTADQHLLNPS